MKILLSCLLILMLFADSSQSGKPKGKVKPTPEPVLKPVPEPDHTESRYEKFRRQHIDIKMAENKCDSVIRDKYIYNNDNSCKETNTFILDDPAKVKGICDGEENPNGEMTLSKEKFKIVKCTLKNTGARKPKCQYRGILLTNRKLLVRCEDKLPVHFADDKL